MKADIRERIQIDPGIHFGEPSVVGTRVMDVLELIREGFSFEQITHDYYSDLQIEDFEDLYGRPSVAAPPCGSEMP